MRLLKQWFVLGALALLGACGGGSSDEAGTPVLGGGDGSGTTEAYAISVDVQRAGSSISSDMTSTETVQAVATVKTEFGDPVEGVVVTFSEADAGLLKFAPTSATALTDADGKASVDISALDNTTVGATTVVASASISDTDVSAQQSLSIKAGSGTGGTPATPAAIAFVGSNPADQAIVIQGAGGSGRAEAAILTFKIVDASNAPINGATVNFEINANNGGASLQPSSAISNSSGEVTTTVSSGTSPASIVVQATADAVASVSVQSDTLLVSNGVPIDVGFEINAAKYNLDGHTTGASTTITARVRDEFGNPVPDGVAVSFVTDYGVIASSNSGGCTTVNGQCTVDFSVQNPRGGITTIVATVRVGSTDVFTRSLELNMAGVTAGVSPATLTSYLAIDDGGDPLLALDMQGSCKRAFEAVLTDGNNRAPAAGTGITVPFTDTGMTVAIKSGSPVLDQLGAGFPPVIFGFEIDLTGDDSDCNSAGGNAGSKLLRFQYTTSEGIVFSQLVEVVYPIN